MMEIIIFLIVISLSARILGAKIRQRIRNAKRSKKQKKTVKYIKKAYETTSNTYTQKWMFTQNEKTAYYKIKEIADKNGLLVFAKVRLLDLITPIQSHEQYKSNLYRIQAKHVDFVLCKSNLVAKYIIEIDDNSHDAPERKERDVFVDNVLTNCGYKVMRTRYVNNEELERFISEQ